MIIITLRRGSRGNEVKDLQRLLSLFGYYGGAIDGSFGPATERAVRGFQKNNNLVVDGIAGPKTCAALNGRLQKQPPLRRGSRGPAVIVMQAILTNLKYNCGAIDGSFGPATERTVIEYQRDNKLKVDGRVGPQTWGSFSRANAKPASKEPVYYSQSDTRWRHIMYSNHNDTKQTIGTSGCGPTCGAMIVATWKDNKITPVQASRDALKNGFRTYNNGTAWAYWPWLAKMYGLKFEQTATTDKAVQAIKEGALVIASMGPGYFTKGGHYILLWGTKDGNIICHDPAKKERNRASISLFKKENKQYFIFKK